VKRSPDVEATRAFLGVVLGGDENSFLISYRLAAAAALVIEDAVRELNETLRLALLEEK
jgi:hypothetical protein